MRGGKGLNFDGVSTMSFGLGLTLLRFLRVRLAIFCALVQACKLEATFALPVR